MLKVRCFYVVVSLLILVLMEVSGQKLSKNSPVRFLALGDSYTIGESVAEVQRWPNQLADALGRQGYRIEDPEIVAVTGWRTDDLSKGLKTRNLPKVYDLVSLLIGVNNQYQGRGLAEYRSEFESLLSMAIDYAQGDPSRVVVLSIPDYGYTPFGLPRQQEITEALDLFNKANREITLKKGAAYIDITDISRRGLKEPALIAHDGLHPSGEMYRLWVERILQHPDVPWLWKN